MDIAMFGAFNGFWKGGKLNGNNAQMAFKYGGDNSVASREALKTVAQADGQPSVVAKRVGGSPSESYGIGKDTLYLTGKHNYQTGDTVKMAADVNGKVQNLGDYQIVYADQK